MADLFPIAEKINTTRKFGLVDGEFRGPEQIKLMNPPAELSDDYYWIRDDSRTCPKVLEHIRKENVYTDLIMSSNKDLTQSIYQKVKSYIVESYDTFPYKLNQMENWRYFRRFKEGQDYPSHWRKQTLRDGLEVEEELLDINKLAQGVSQCDVKSFKISPTHKFISYGVDYDGSELYEFVIVDLETRQQVITSSIIPKLAYCSYFWAGPTMLYYLVGDNSNRLYQLWTFDVSTGLTQLVFEELDSTQDLGCSLSSDKRYVIITSGNYDSNWSRYIDLDLNPYQIFYFLPRLPDIKYSIDHHDSGFWFIHTNSNAINWQIMKIHQDVEIKWENLESFIPPNDIVHIDGFELFSNFVVFETKINGGVYLNIVDLFRTEIKILTHLDNRVLQWDQYIEQDFASLKTKHVYSIGTGINPIYHTDKLNVCFSSMIDPTKLYDYNVNTLEYVQVYEQIVPNYDQNLYESNRIWIDSDDTRLGIPVSLVYRKDLFKANGTNPLYLYGYGSYGITVEPDFDYQILPLLDKGYVYAIAHVRGGGFLGWDWYEAGRMDKKLNTFNDFIRCTEYFAQSGLIDPKKVIIEGRSAGGLLIGACTVMRPDLFWISIPGVPFVDVLNTMSDSTIPLTKEEWTQWGNPNEFKWFEYMNKYCPYYNVKPNIYPHMYCTGGLHDPRVPYWEILKLLAKIRSNKLDQNIQVIRIETTQGHFGGSSRYKSIEELAEKYTFIFTR